MTRPFTALAFVLLAGIGASSAFAQPARVELTWMSIANRDVKIGDKRIVMDAYISRLPNSIFYPPPAYPNDMYAYTKGPQGVAWSRSARSVTRNWARTSWTTCWWDTAIGTTAGTRRRGPASRAHP